MAKTPSVYVASILISLFLVGQGNRCDYLNFDPKQLFVSALGHSETYVFTRLPRSSCNGVVLNYINFCFLLARPRLNSTLETISEVAILLRQGNQYYVSAIVPIVTQTSFCEGDTVQFKSQSLCCISRSLAHSLSFSLVIQYGELDYTIALRGPSAEGITAYVPMSYTDYRTAGYITTIKPMLESHLNIKADFIPGHPRLPVLSFSQSPVTYEEDLPCLTQESMETNLKTETSIMETEQTMETCMCKVQQTSTGHIPAVAVITVLAILLTVFILCSIILGLSLLRICWTRYFKGNRSALSMSKKSHEDKKFSTTAELQKSSEPRIPTAPNSFEMYDVVSHHPTCCNSIELVEGYDVLYASEFCSSCADRLHAQYEKKAPHKIAAAPFPGHLVYSPIVGRGEGCLKTPTTKSSASSMSNPMYGNNEIV